MPQAAKYNQRITIEQLKDSVQPDALGNINLEDDANWTPFIKRWAAFKSAGGTKQNTGQTQRSEIKFVVELRSDPETRQITPEMRIRKGNRKLEINWVHNTDEADKEIEIEAIEVLT